MIQRMRLLVGIGMRAFSGSAGGGLSKARSRCWPAELLSSGWGSWPNPAGRRADIKTQATTRRAGIPVTLPAFSLTKTLSALPPLVVGAMRACFLRRRHTTRSIDRAGYFLLSLRLRTASLRESNELSVLTGLELPWLSALSS